MVDTIKAVYAYTIILVTIVGGFLFLYKTYADPGAAAVIVVVAGYIGMALQFVTGSEIATRTARQQQAATNTATATAAATIPVPQPVSQTVDGTVGP